MITLSGAFCKIKYVRCSNSTNSIQSTWSYQGFCYTLNNTWISFKMNQPNKSALTELTNTVFDYTTGTV